MFKIVVEFDWEKTRIKMTITVEAVVENGLLRPIQPLPFQEKEKEQVRITITRGNMPTHANRALTMEEMAKELNEASQPTTQPSVPLKHKVDYSQVF